MITYTKHPDEVKEIPFDFNARLAELNDSLIDYVAVGDSGITVAAIVQSAGVVTVLYSGGTNGNAYNIGVKATTSGGDIIIDLRRMRVAGLPAVPQTVGGATDIIIDGGVATSFQ